MEQLYCCLLPMLAGNVSVVPVLAVVTIAIVVSCVLWHFHKSNSSRTELSNLPVMWRRSYFISGNPDGSHKTVINKNVHPFPADFKSFYNLMLEVETGESLVVQKPDNLEGYEDWYIFTFILKLKSITSRSGSIEMTDGTSFVVFKDAECRFVISNDDRSWVVDWEHDETEKPEFVVRPFSEEFRLGQFIT